MGRFLITLMEIPNRNSKKLELSLLGEKVFIRSFLSPDEIGLLSFNESMPGYARYRHITSDKKALIETASIPDVNVTLAIGPNRRIIGLGIMGYPLPEERWNEVGERVMMEVAALEVSIHWRSLGLSNHILRLLVNHPLSDERIFLHGGIFMDMGHRRQGPVGYGVSGYAHKHIQPGRVQDFSDQ